jgi:hypothetical protein
VNFGAHNLGKEFLESKEFRKNAIMPCHAMHSKQDYFIKDFWYARLV